MTGGACAVNNVAIAQTAAANRREKKRRIFSLVLFYCRAGPFPIPNRLFHFVKVSFLAIPSRRAERTAALEMDCVAGFGGSHSFIALLIVRRQGRGVLGLVLPTGNAKGRLAVN